MNDLEILVKQYNEVCNLKDKYENELFNKYVIPILDISDEKEQNEKLVEIICQLPQSYARHRALTILFELDEKLGIKRKGDNNA